MLMLIGLSQSFHLKFSLHGSAVLFFDELDLLVQFLQDCAWYQDVFGYQPKMKCHIYLTVAWSEQK